MLRPRIIPVLLLKGHTLVKSVRFKEHRYIGDPLNAARIFNELHADELIVLDIAASADGRVISLDFVESLAEEVTMPFSVGGGIRTIEGIRKLVRSGIEKVVIGRQAVLEPDFVRQAAAEFGSSTISVCIDVKKDVFGRRRVRVNSGSSAFDPVAFAQIMEEKGAGELIVQSVDRDGMMNGYDLDLTGEISKSVSVPVVALGGAGSLNDLAAGFHQGFANAVAAGSLFVYQNRQRGVLINYPESKDFF